ncbi:MAG: uroporphyrinogen decarboxylase family protein [Planctomycetota bacterium]
MKLGFKEYSGKPDKNRLINALKGEPVDRVPNFEILIADKLVEKILGRHIGSSAIGFIKSGSESLEKTRKTRKAAKIPNEEFRPVHAADYIELCKAIGQDAIAIGSWNAPFFTTDEQGNLILAKGRKFKNRDDIKKNLILPTENMAWFESWLGPYIREYKKEAAKENIAVMVSCGALIEQIYEHLFGIEDFSLLLYDDYQLIEELLDAGVEFWVNTVDFLLKEGVDLIQFADDFAYKSGLLIDPDKFRKLWLHRYKKIIEPVVNSGRPVCFHSDGNILEMIDDLIEMGVSCLNPIEPYGMDIEFVKKRYGKNLALLGNIDVGFPLARGKAEDVEADVKKHMEMLKPGYGYICASSHSLSNDIPGENLVAFFDAIHEYGVY